MRREREEEAARAEKKGRKKNLALLSFAEDEGGGGDDGGGDGGGAPAAAPRGIASAHDRLEDARCARRRRRGRRLGPSRPGAPHQADRLPGSALPCGRHAGAAARWRSRSPGSSRLACMCPMPQMGARAWRSVRPRP
jgi:hypothetical protein